MNNSLDIFNSEMEQLAKQFPQAKVPPNCYKWMKVKELDYESRTMLKIEVVVTEEMLNPMRVMQGGFVTAAFDNAFGPLSYVAAKNPCSTLDMHTQYIRSIGLGETLTVTVRVVSRGPVSIHLSGEAYNSKGKLVATCSSNMIVMK
ncbi:MAG: PaaI family thioesterase [Bacteroidota bacterium]